MVLLCGQMPLGHLGGWTCLRNMTNSQDDKRTWDGGDGGQGGILHSSMPLSATLRAMSAAPPLPSKPRAYSLSTYVNQGSHYQVHINFMDGHHLVNTHPMEAYSVGC